MWRFCKMVEDKSKQNDNVTNPLILQMRKDLGFTNNNEVKSPISCNEDEVEIKEDGISKRGQLKSPLRSMLNYLNNRRFIFKIVTITVFIIVVIGITLYDKANVSEAEINKLADKGKIEDIADIIENIKNYRCHPNQDQILKLAIDKIHQKDTQKYISLTWGIINKNDSPIKPSYIISLADISELETLSQMYMNGGGNIKYNSIEPVNFSLIIDRMKKLSADSKIISMVKSLQRSDEINYVKSDIVNVLNNCNNLFNYNVLHQKFVLYNIPHQALGDVFNNYTIEEEELRKYQRKVDSYNDLNKQYSNVDEEIKGLEYKLTQVGEYQGNLISGHIVSQLSIDSYDLLVEGGQNIPSYYIGQHVILVTSPKKYQAQGYVKGIPVTFSSETREVQTYGGFIKDVAIFREKSRESISMEAKGRIEIYNEREELKREIAELKKKSQELAEAKNNLQYNKEMAYQYANKLESIKKQWTVAFSSLSDEVQKNINSIATDYIDKKGTYD